MLFSYHLLYFCTALSLIIMLSSHYHHHKSKTFSQLTQCPFTGTLLLLYSLQYLNILQAGLKVLFDPSDWTKYSPSSQVTCIPLTERQRLKDDHLSTSFRFFSLPLGIGPNDRGPPFKLVIQATIYLLVLGFEPTSSVFLGECVTHKCVTKPKPIHGLPPNFHDMLNSGESRTDKVLGSIWQWLLTWQH